MRLIPPMSKAGSGELLAVAATFHELGLKSADLLVEQVVRLMNQANNRIGPNLGTLMLQPVRIQRPPLTIRQFSQIRLISPIFFKPPRHLANRTRFRARQRPQRQAPVAQVILVVEQQLFEARPRDVDQPQFRLRRSRCLGP